MLKELLARAETQMPVSVMARVALERAIEPPWVDEVFEAHRRRQYPRELLFSTVVELVLLVSLGLRPSLHAAARKAREPAGVAGGAVRQDEVHRAGDPEGAGQRQRRALGPGGPSDATAIEPAGLAAARTRRQPSAG